MPHAGGSHLHHRVGSLLKAVDRVNVEKQMHPLEISRQFFWIMDFKEIFAHITLSFSDLATHNAEHFLLGNPVHEKPFIHIDENQLFSAQWAVMGHHTLGLLEKFCATDEMLREKYNKGRAEYLEDELETLFKNHFPGAQIFAGSKWTGKDGKLYENDLLILIDSFALVVEAKSGQVSPPAKRGAQKRLFNTLAGTD